MSNFLTIEKYNKKSAKEQRIIKKILLTLILLVVPFIILAAWVARDLLHSGNLLFAQAATGINRQLNYQGKMATSTGAPMPSGNYNFRFEIYNDPVATGTALLWSEDWTTSSPAGPVNINSGVFSVALGTSTPLNIDFNQYPLYLQVSFDYDGDGIYEEVFSPRKMLTASPYAFNADAVNGYSASTTAASNTLMVLDSQAGMTLSGITTTAGLVSQGNLAVLGNSNLSTTSIAYLGLGSDYFSSLTGTNLYNNAGTLEVTSSPTFSGTVSTTDLVVSDTANINNLIAASSSLTNLTWNNATGTGETNLNTLSVSATSTLATTSITYLGLGGDYFSSLLGSNLFNSSGVLAVTSSPTFTGTVSTTDLVVSDTANINNLTLTSSTVGNLTWTDATGTGKTNLNNLTVVGTSSLATTSISGDLTAGSSTINELTWIDATGTNLNLSGDLTVSGTSTLATTTIASLTVSGTSTFGDIIPQANLTYNLGSSAYGWDEAWINNLYLGSSTWQFSQGADGHLSIGDVGGAERLAIDTSGNVSSSGYLAGGFNSRFGDGTNELRVESFTDTNANTYPILTSYQSGTPGQPFGLSDTVNIIGSNTTSPSLNFTDANGVNAASIQYDSGKLVFSNSNSSTFTEFQQMTVFHGGIFAASSVIGPKLSIVTGATGTFEMLELMNGPRICITGCANDVGDTSNIGFSFNTDVPAFPESVGVANIGAVLEDNSSTTYKGDLVFSTANGASPQERMRILYNGNVGIGTSTLGTKLAVLGSGNIETAIFNGSGTDDLIAGGVYNGADVGAITYTVIIDSTGTPDTFAWQKDGGAFTTGTAVTTATQPLADGITVIFSTTTGHTLGDQWTITAIPEDSLAIYNAAGADTLLVRNNGNVGIGTSTPDNALQVMGAISLASTTITNSSYALYNQGGALYWNGSPLITSSPTFSGTVSTTDLAVSDTANINNLIAASSSLTNLTWNNATGTGETNLNNLTTVGQTNLATTSIIGDLTAGSSSITNLTWNNATGTGITYLQNLSADNATIATSTITNLGLNSIYFTSLTGSNLLNVNGILSVTDSPSFAGTVSTTNLVVYGTTTLATTSITYFGLGSDYFSSLLGSNLYNNAGTLEVTSSPTFSGTVSTTYLVVSDTANINNLIAASSSLTNLTWNNATGTGETNLNNLTVSGTSSLATTSVTYLGLDSDYFSSLLGSNLYNNASVLEVTSSPTFTGTVSTTDLVVSDTATINNLIVASSSLTNLTWNNATSTGETNLNDLTAIGLTNLATTSITGDLTAGSSTINELTWIYATGTNLNLTGDLTVFGTSTLATTTVSNLTVSGTSTFGDIIPQANLTYNLGSSAYRWNEAWINNLYLGSSTWQFSQGADGHLSIGDVGGAERLAIDTSGNVGIGTSTPGARFQIMGSGSIGAAIFNGSGTDDLIAGGTYTGADSGAVTYTVIIDSTGTPDTFAWQKDGGTFTTGTAITAGIQPLADGVTITFATSTGHTLNDQWTITAIPEDSLVIQNAAGVNTLSVGNNGKVEIGTANDANLIVSTININGFDFPLISFNNQFWGPSTGLGIIKQGFDIQEGVNSPRILFSNSDFSEISSLTFDTSTNNLVFDDQFGNFFFNQGIIVPALSLPNANATFTGNLSQLNNDASFISNVSNLVPYAGASTSVNLGFNNLLANGISSVYATATYLFFNGATGINLTADNLTANVSASLATTTISGKLGIGLAVPTTALEVAGTISSTELTVASATLASLNVGSGLSSPGFLLTVAGTSSMRTILPAADMTYDLGSSTLRWSNLWADNIHMGGTASSAPVTQLDIMGYTNPAVVGTTSLGANPVMIHVQGKYVYSVSDGASDFQILDVSNPTSPQQVSTSSMSWGPIGIYVSGRYAYIANNHNSSTLEVWDVSNPGAPVRKSWLELGGEPYYIYVAGRYAYVANDAAVNELQIIDVSDPGHPFIASTIAAGSGTLDVYVEGRYAYVADFTGGSMEIFDVNDHRHPVQVGTSTLGGQPRDIYVQGRYAYIANDPGSSDNYLQIIDVVDVTKPEQVGTSTFPSPAKLFSVKVQGRYAYLADNSGKMQIVDVSDPMSPVQISHVNVGGKPRYLYVSGRYAYINNESSASPMLQIVDLGGAYLQELEAGSAEVATLNTRSNVQVGNDLDVRGAVNVGNGLLVNGAFSVFGGGDQSVLSVDYTGKVGIGTATPNSTLSLQTNSFNVFDIASTSGNYLLQTKNLSAPFGLAMNAGAFMDRNSSINEEFNAYRTTRADLPDLAGNQADSFGDNRGWGVYSSVNNCTYGEVSSGVNGRLRIQANAANTGCLAMMDETSGVVRQIFSAANLPVILMKVQPSNVGANNVFFVGLASTTGGTTTDPATFIGFTNNGGNTWTGRTADGISSTTVVCSGQSIVTSTFAELMIEVRSATDVHFFIDNDTSDGVNFVECGQSTTTIPSGKLGAQLAYQARSGGAAGEYLDVDFFRAWQDESIYGGGFLAVATTNTPSQLPNSVSTQAITISTSVPSTTQDVLYNQGGDLYWNGVNLSGVSGISSLNGLSTTTQLFATGTAGNDFNIDSTGTTHTFNLPDASAFARGLLTSADWSIFDNKQDALAATGSNIYLNGNIINVTSSPTFTGNLTINGTSNLATTTITSLTVSGNATATSLAVGTSIFGGFNYGSGDMSVQNTLFANNVSSTNITSTNLYSSNIKLDNFTNGSIIFATSGGALSQDSSLYWNSSNKSLGINVTNTIDSLAVYGNAINSGVFGTYSSSGSAYLEVSNSGDVSIGSTSTYNIPNQTYDLFSVAGSSYLAGTTTINGNLGFSLAAGNINGIYSRLNGSGNRRAALLFEHQYDGNQMGAAYLGVGYDLIQNGVTSPLYTYTNQYFSPNIFQVNATGFHFLSEAATGTENSTFTPTELLTVRNIGNLGGYLGIGNTSPVRPLSIVVNHGAGQIDMTENGTGTSDYAGLEMFNDLGHFMTLGITSENNTAHSPDNGYIATQGDLVFYTNNSYAEQMRILANGNVGIGTSTPNQLLTVVGTSSLRTVLPEANLAYNLGSMSLRWANLYASTGTLAYLNVTTVSTTALQVNGNATSSSLVLGTSIQPGFTYASGNLSATNIYSANISTTNATATNLIFTNATGSNLTLTGTASSTNLLFTNATGTGSLVMNGASALVSSTNLRATNATATNFWLGSNYQFINSVTGTNLYLSAGILSVTNTPTFVSSTIGILYVTSSASLATTTIGGNLLTVTAATSTFNYVSSSGVRINNGDLTISSSTQNMVIGVNAFPNYAASGTIPGTSHDPIAINLGANTTLKSGLFTEANGALLSYGINVTQIAGGGNGGIRDTSTIGAIFRMDTRAGNPYFSVKKQAIGTTTETADFQISAAGNVAIGSTFGGDLINGQPLAQLHIWAQNSSTRGLIVQGVTGTTANLMEFRDVSNTILMDAKILSNNFGVAMNTGAFISNNSYIGEEFDAFRTTQNGGSFVGNQATSFGDNNGWGYYCSNVGPGRCTMSSQALNGFVRLAVGATPATGIMTMMDETVNVPHAILNANNLPVIMMKIRPSNVGALNVFLAGMDDATTGRVIYPTNFIGFTNNGTANWYGSTILAGASTTVSCGVAVSTTQFALVKIEVVSSTLVKFYIDPNVSDGISFTYCGQSTTNIPTINLAPEFEYQIRALGTVSQNMDVDFIRAWQDDSAIMATSTEETTSTEATTTELVVNDQPERTWVTVSDNSDFQGSIKVAGQITVGADTAGQAKILAGATAVKVPFTDPYTTMPIITLTALGPVNGQYWLKTASTTAADGSVNYPSFSIILNQSQAQDIMFNWQALASADTAKISVSNDTSELINISVATSTQSSSSAPETAVNNLIFGGSGSSISDNSAGSGNDAASAIAGNDQPAASSGSGTDSTVSVDNSSSNDAPATTVVPDTQPAETPAADSSAPAAAPDSPAPPPVDQTPTP